jgi:NAD(P)-dependent dehydrogenase (short-subunit alcohol dehydrogenase family)
MYIILIGTTGGRGAIVIQGPHTARGAGRGEPVEVASKVPFLGMVAATYATGQVIFVDGGRSISA